jgi:hypothetical protein
VETVVEGIGDHVQPPLLERGDEHGGTTHVVGRVGVGHVGRQRRARKRRRDLVRRDRKDEADRLVRAVREAQRARPGGARHHRGEAAEQRRGDVVGMALHRGRDAERVLVDALAGPGERSRDPGDDGGGARAQAARQRDRARQAELEPGRIAAGGRERAHDEVRRVARERVGALAGRPHDHAGATRATHLDPVSQLERHREAVVAGAEVRRRGRNADGDAVSHRRSPARR